MSQYNNDFQTKKIGEILIEMKLATEQDVWNALVISKKEHSLIGSTLVDMGVITLEQLKTALKLQLVMEIVTEEQIASIDQNVLSLFPEDFIKIYQFIPLSSDGRNVSVGMVNPNDKTALDNIIMFSGMKPVIYILTYYEFQKIIQKYFKE